MLVLPRGPSRIAVLVALLVLGAGCASSNQASTRSQDDVVEALRGDDVTLQVAGPANQSVLSTPGQAYTTGGGTLELYIYRSESGAVLDVRQLKRYIQPSPRPPSYYHGGNVIAIYFGDAIDVERALSDVVGPRLF